MQVGVLGDDVRQALEQPYGELIVLPAGGYTPRIGERLGCKRSLRHWLGAGYRDPRYGVARQTHLVHLVHPAHDLKFDPFGQIIDLGSAQTVSAQTVVQVRPRLGLNDARHRPLDQLQRRFYSLNGCRIAPSDGKFDRTADQRIARLHRVLPLEYPLGNLIEGLSADPRDLRPGGCIQSDTHCIAGRKRHIGRGKDLDVFSPRTIDRLRGFPFLEKDVLRYALSVGSGERNGIVPFGQCHPSCPLPGGIHRKGLSLHGDLRTGRGHSPHVEGGRVGRVGRSGNDTELLGLDGPDGCGRQQKTNGFFEHDGIVVFVRSLVFDKDRKPGGLFPAQKRRKNTPASRFFTAKRKSPHCRIPLARDFPPG